MNQTNQKCKHEQEAWIDGTWKCDNCNRKVPIEELPNLRNKIEAQTSEKGWEEIFDELDKNELWSEICDKHAPGGMFEIDDDSLQSLIAQVASNLIASERSKLLHAVKGQYSKVLSLYGTPMCENLHHPKNYQHKWGVECPVIKEIDSLLAKLNELT